MAQAARKLAAVPPPQPDPEPVTPARDPDLTREAMASWTKEQRICRARGRHRWGPHTVWEHRTYYDVVERCRCGNRRSADFSKTGRQLTRWLPDYRDGYLLPKGAAPIEPEQKDDLVLADLLGRRIVEAAEDDDEGGA